MNPDRRYRHRKTGQIARIVDSRGALANGRFCRVYELAWDDGSQEEMVSGTFYRQFDRVEEVDA